MNKELLNVIKEMRKDVIPPKPQEGDEIEIIIKKDTTDMTVEMHGFNLCNSGLCTKNCESCMFIFCG